MNSITENTIDSNDYVKNSNISVNSSSTPKTNNHEAFLKTLNDVSSESGKFKVEGYTDSYAEAFFSAIEIMNAYGCNIPSINIGSPSYLDLIDQMKDFFSSDFNIFSDKLINFLDVLKERLKLNSID